MVAPKHHRGFSFGSKSSKSNRSNSSGNNDPAIEETAEEKASHHLHSKADPTVAMSELQPSVFPIHPPSFPFLYISHSSTFILHIHNIHISRY